MLYVFVFLLMNETLLFLKYHTLVLLYQFYVGQTGKYLNNYCQGKKYHAQMYNKFSIITNFNFELFTF